MMTRWMINRPSDGLPAEAQRVVARRPYPPLPFVVSEASAIAGLVPP